MPPPEAPPPPGARAPLTEGASVEPASIAKDIAWLKLDKMDGSGAEPEEEWREFYGDLEAMITVARNKPLLALLNADTNPAGRGAAASRARGLGAAAAQLRGADHSRVRLVRGSTVPDAFLGYDDFFPARRLRLCW